VTQPVYSSHSAVGPCKLSVVVLFCPFFTLLQMRFATLTQ